MAKPNRRRVYLFITRRHLGRTQLLAFSHIDIGVWAGIQTPGGTMEPGESPAESALREATEETGLTGFGAPTLLAEDVYENDDEILHRFFFHLPCHQDTDENWDHVVDGIGIDTGMRFRCMWLDMPEVQGLDAHFRAYLDLVPYELEG